MTIQELQLFLHSHSIFTGSNISGQTNRNMNKRIDFNTWMQILCKLMSMTVWSLESPLCLTPAPLNLVLLNILSIILSHRDSIDFINQKGPLLPITDNPDFPKGPTFGLFLGGSRVNPLCFNWVIFENALLLLSSIQSERTLATNTSYQ